MDVDGDQHEPGGVRRTDRVYGSVLVVATAWALVATLTSMDTVRDFLRNPLVWSIAIAPGVAFLNGASRWFVRREGGPRWSDWYAGMDLALVALTSEVLFIASAKTTTRLDVVAPWVFVTLMAFIGIMWLHRLCEPWDHHPVWRVLLLNVLANVVGLVALVGFVLVAEL